MAQMGCEHSLVHTHNHVVYDLIVAATSSLQCSRVNLVKEGLMMIRGRCARWVDQANSICSQGKERQAWEGFSSMIGKGPLNLQITLFT